MNEVKEYTEKVFEDIKHIDKNNHEYWLARDLMPLLEYSKWENFNNVIQKAVTSYKNSNNDDTYWLPKVRKPIITGKGKEEFIKDYKLSRYICYLIVQNANSKKKMVALGQTYFAIQTRKQEFSRIQFTQKQDFRSAVWRCIYGTIKKLYRPFWQQKEDKKNSLWKRVWINEANKLPPQILVKRLCGGSCLSRIIFPARSYGKS